MAKICRVSRDGYIIAADGIMRKTLVFGENTLMTEFLLEKGKLLPMHSHPEEQTGYLVSGHIILIIDGIRRDIKPGDSWSIHGGSVHGAEIVEDSIALEVFSPVRKDYLS